MTPLASSTNDKKLKNRGINTLIDPDDRYFISIEGSYSHVEVALFYYKNNQYKNNQKNNSHDSIKILESIEKLGSIVKNEVKASSHLVPYIDTILQENSMTIHDLSFIAIDQGPGAFTSLRVSIATVNGIAFAHKIPLIGVSGLDALCRDNLKAHADSQTSGQDYLIVCLLNAFNNDVYFSINKVQDNSIITTLEKSCKKIDILLEELQERPGLSKNISNTRSQSSIIFTGNGALLHQEIITKTFGEDSLATPLHTICSAQSIAEIALERWESTSPDDLAYELSPNYMKTQEYPKRK